MRPALFLIACLLSAALTARAQPPQPTEIAGLEFAKPQGVSLTLDAWIPASPKPQMAVILVHGGGWTKGDKRTFIRPWFPFLTGANIAWFTINYRLAPQWKHPAAVEDVEAAVRFLRKNRKRFNIDPSRIVLMGESAGGHLVSLAGVRGKVDVASVISFYGVHDIPYLVDQRKEALLAIGPYLGVSDFSAESEKVMRAASPIAAVREAMPPYLFIHGTADALVPHQQSVLMCEKMKAFQNVCRVELIDKAPHGVEPWEKNEDWKKWRVPVRTWLDSIR
jgi:alpha-L-fucosidase 2